MVGGGGGIWTNGCKNESSIRGKVWYVYMQGFILNNAYLYNDYIIILD